MSESRQQTIDSTKTPSAAKKAYSKPEFRFESIFETRALSCGKQQAHQASCRFNRKNS